MRVELKVLSKAFYLFILVCLVFPQPKHADSLKKDPVLKSMEVELERSMKILGKKGNPPPYFICYKITEKTMFVISASYGSIKKSSKIHLRLLDVDVRVGDYKLDSTHPIRGRFGFGYNFSFPIEISIEDDPNAIRSTIWLETDKKYKEAVGSLIKIKANKRITVKEEDLSDDFSKESPVKFIGEKKYISHKIGLFEKQIKSYSSIFNNYPEIYESGVSLNANAENKYFVSSEGTVLRHGRTHWRLGIFARTKANDGMDLFKYHSFDSRTVDHLPDKETIKTAINLLIKDLLALREAPLMDPYTGPAILTGKAAGVFFHEIFGHRVEGHRQKDEKEGQTFKKKINKQILPTFISVFDDPNLSQIEGVDLNGHYFYDDEGVKSEKVELVKNGILKRFLMSRSPVMSFDKSNGHGRSQPGYRPVSRQGNLIIRASKTVTEKKLRQMLIEECKSQKKPYGLLFKDISGGFTFTGRFIPQSYNITPIIVYKIYTDGRKDELIRGVDLIGTPLISFSKIIGCGQKIEVFNGYCGAESGSIPVSAVSPSILTAQIEIQKKHKAVEKPPVLPPPVRRNK